MDNFYGVDFRTDTYLRPWTLALLSGDHIIGVVGGSGYFMNNSFCPYIHLVNLYKRIYCVSIDT